MMKGVNMPNNNDKKELATIKRRNRQRQRDANHKLFANDESMSKIHSQNS